MTGDYADTGIESRIADAGQTYADGATTIPGFTRLKNPDSFPGNYNEFMYKGPDGQIYGSETYGAISAGRYPNIYDPNKATMNQGGRVGLANGTLSSEDVGKYSFMELMPEFKEEVEEYKRTEFEKKNPPEKIKKLMEKIKKMKKSKKEMMAQGGRIGKFGGGIGAGMPRIPMGMPRVNAGGIRELDYRQSGGFVPMGVKEKADDVPAMLSKNEFVMTADAVKGAGGGSVEKGAQRMYDTMKRLEGRVA